jgi:P2-related tail formation protein
MDSTFDVLDPNEDEFIRYKRYVMEPNESKMDPLEWWRRNKVRFPHLFELAMDQLQVPASSTASERAFSQMGRLITKIRSNLKPETAGMLHILKSNGDLW